ncbi:MAG: amidohydrolase [Actinomycetota bacterium]
MTSLLIRNARLVPVGIDTVGNTPSRAALPEAPLDVRITDGVVSELGPHLANHAEEEVDVAGRFLLPGLWDRHAHWDQWAAALTRIDLAGTTSADDAVARLARILPTLPDDGATAFGFGHRSALWPRPATVAELDAVSGGRPVVLVSGDAHNGWLNSRALELLGLSPRTGVLEEREWFDVFPRVQSMAGSAPESQEEAFRDAARKGVVGVVDMEFGGPFLTWPERIAAGERRLKVRTCTYPSHLDRAIELGLRTGTALDGGEGLVTMGPLKIISDGSLNTRTAYCAEPYADAHGLEHPRGVLNFAPEELTELLTRATTAGLDVAVHAIGDAAITNALDAMVATGARGSIEHAQLLATGDIPRLARHGIVASMQPAHLLDDRDVAAVCWPDRADRCFMLRTLLEAGVSVALGSDAPVSPLDPWLEMVAAVLRSADDRDAWNPGESITAAQALACSTDGRGTVAVGSPADLAVVETDPTAPGTEAPRAVADALRGTRVALTVVDGRVTHLAL